MQKLVEAIKVGDVSRILEILQSNQPLDFSFDDNIVIRLAIKQRIPPEVIRLIVNHPDYLKLTRFKHLSIILASSTGYLEAVQTLLQCPHIDPVDNDNFSLELAAHNGHIEIVKLLISDPRVNSTIGNCHVMGAEAKGGHLEIIEYLLANTPASTKYSIRGAIDGNHLFLVERLLNDPRFDPTEGDITAIEVATDNKNIQGLELLLNDSRVNPAVHNNSALLRAVYRRNIAAIKRLLLDPRVDPFDKNGSIIEVAKDIPDKQYILMLLQSRQI